MGMCVALWNSPLIVVKETMRPALFFFLFTLKRSVLLVVNHFALVATVWCSPPLPLFWKRRWGMCARLAWHELTEAVSDMTIKKNKFWSDFWNDLLFWWDYKATLNCQCEVNIFDWALTLECHLIWTYYQPRSNDLFDRMLNMSQNAKIITFSHNATRYMDVVRNSLFLAILQMTLKYVWTSLAVNIWMRSHLHSCEKVQSIMFTSHKQFCISVRSSKLGFSCFQV